MNARRLKHLLLDRGMTLASLARVAGLSYDRAVRIVHGYRKPQSEEIEAIARVLGVDARILMGE